MSYVLKTGDGRYYCASVKGAAVWSRHQSAAWRFELRIRAREFLRTLLELPNGFTARDARPVLLGVLMRKAVRNDPRPHAQPGDGVKGGSR